MLECVSISLGFWLNASNLLTTQFQIVYTFACANIIGRQAFDTTEIVHARRFQCYAAIEALAHDRVLDSVLIVRHVSGKMP
jgi:hypothetical protein